MDSKCHMQINLLNMVESRQIGSGQTGDGKSNIDILGTGELKWTGMGEF